ncbi:hypothetical protein CMO90_00015 [Candidatus Woesearchaeota archaeon]|jgi:DNA-binding Lrp family transcriptional regulator|nr:hypothetical protein [Candidatus Woesearchaeota archaeon]|tara:strand:- start:987 stop:1955 length:969 start_codon:yes stop_codon:yes gene_type:complete
MIRIIHKILYFLDEDSRTTLSKIAKRLKTSEQRISYTVKSMIKKRQIKGFATVFDYAKFDYNAYIVAFRTNYQLKEETNKLLNDIKEHPETILMEKLQGRLDLITMFLSPNPSSFNKTLKKLISDNKKVIRENHICTVIVMHKFNKQYLHPWIKIKDDKVIGGDRDPLKLSETQKKICKALLDKPTGKLNELGKTTKLTFKTLTKKIKELRKKRVIRTFEPIINHEKIGIDRKKILLKYESYDQRIENNLTSFCKLNPNIVSITKTFGSWDSIIDFESIKEERINEFINKLRETFEGIIASIEIIDVERTDKRIYLPSNHFS